MFLGTVLKLLTRLANKIKYVVTKLLLFSIQLKIKHRVKNLEEPCRLTACQNM